MPGFFLSLVAVLLVGFGGRDQLLVAQLSERLGASRNLLALALAASIITAGFATAAGIAVAAILPAAAKIMLVALALLLAAAELAWPWRRPEVREPTRSGFAIFVVLVAAQIGDGARFLILAIAVATGAPVLAAIGGAVGGGAALFLGWSMGAGLAANIYLRRIRMVFAGVLLFMGVAIGLSARGVLG